MSTLSLSQLILDDRWPGAPSTLLGRPTGGWDNTTDNFTTTSSSTTPSYPLGTKVVAYTDNTWCPGWYTMMYLSFHDYSAQDISGDYSDAAFWCSHYDASDAELYQVDISVCPYYIVSRCYTAVNTDVTRGAPVAVPCATIASDGTGAYAAGYGDAYGWFWVGGVCPCADVTLMQGTASVLYGADVTMAVTKKGAVYAYMDGTTASLNFRSSGDLTQPHSDPNPPIGWACTTVV